MKLGKGMSALGTQVSTEDGTVGEIVTTQRSPKPNGTVYGVEDSGGKIRGYTADQLYPREN